MDAIVNMKRILLVALLINSISLTYALPQRVPGIAYPPHHIKPHTNTLTPSGLSPAQISTAYGFNYVSYTGAGQTIGIVDAYDDPNIEADLGVFSTQFGLPSCTTANGCFTKIYATGSQPAQNSNWDTEIALDVEWVHAVAPNAKIILVEAADASYSSLFTAIGVAVAHGATTISLSWGGSEMSSQTTLDATLRSYIVSSGVTFVAASGDSGYGASYPASSTYVIAVGGTTLSLDAQGNYLGETAWSGSSGGLSRYEPETGPQVTFPIPNDPTAKRGIPDVSYHANPSNGYSVYDSANGGWLVVGGTSAGAPQWAALIALAKSATHKKLTSVYQALYTLGKANYKYYYNDVSSGTNGSCGYYCTSRAGYDYVTGIGSPQVAYIINGLIYDAFA